MSDLTVDTTIRILCFCETGSTEIPDIFSGQTGWNTTCIYDLLKIEDRDFLKSEMVIIQGGHRSIEDLSDLIKFVRSFFTRSFQNSQDLSMPVILVAFAGDPGVEVRTQILETGADDWFPMPISFQEFEMRGRLHMDKKETKKRLVWSDIKFGRAFSYLERFKEKLIKTRKELAGERRLLNQSLKQINAMTREREGLKLTIREIEKQFRENSRGMESLLAGMIESRNERNKGHAGRVAEIAVYVAAGLNLKKSEQEHLRRAAQLHEIGMLFIPGTVFQKKQDELISWEKDLFRHQASKGASILTECHALGSLADVIKGLNEWVDGSGFPEGLKRRYIPIQTRILAGADFLDELMDQESGPEALLERLEIQAGTRLDPRIVNLLGHYVVTRAGRDTHRIREIGLYQIQPDMVIGAGLFTTTGTKLLSAGTVLTEETINMVMKYNREYPLEETVFIRAN